MRYLTGMRSLCLMAVIALAGCRHPLAIQGQGDIVEVSGGDRGCTLEEFQANASRCVDNAVENTDYIVTYEAVPREGWTFIGWTGTACDSNSVYPQCEYRIGRAWIDWFNEGFPNFSFAPLTAIFVEGLEDHVATDVISAVCSSCHVEGGVSGSTRLVFDNSGSENQDSNNIAILQSFIEDIDGGGDLLLDKVVGGSSHGGGAVLPSHTEGYAYLEGLVSSLGGSSGSGGGGQTDGEFWQGITLADARTTLRRAALIFAGRLPTEAEYSLAESGDSGLREALRSLMNGDGFHDFLIRGANDRLHTDGFINGLPFDIMDGNFPYFPELANLQYELLSQGREEEYWMFSTLLNYGAARSPLELIAHVVESELPYTDILTADYMMANPQMSQVFRTGINHSTDAATDFRAGVHQGQVTEGESLQSEFVQNIGLQIFSHGPYVNYPHAGILNTFAFLNRYPTTETNRNRARARWTYLHFLGVDIEKSAARTTDPEALADTNNPTMNNPACTVCHQLNDPVAGTFQNYGNEGWYRSSWGGLDALPETYKYPMYFDEDAAPSPYQTGDTWFRDMRNPGLDGNTAPSQDNSLQWLAQQITSDERFADASVSFWWPAVMGADVLEAPAESTDAGYQQLLNAFEQQNRDREELADHLRSGVNGGAAYNLKDMLVEMAMSPWFRADSIEAGADTNRTRELETVGTDRLLTPAELESKSRELLGFTWGEWPDAYAGDGTYTSLVDRFGVYYGGIDSVGVKDRSRELTSLMSNVASRQALEMACRAVLEDFARSDDQRLLFPGISAETSPGMEGDQSYAMAPTYESRSNQVIELSMEAGNKTLRVQFDNAYWDEDNGISRQLYIDSIRITRNGTEVASFEGEDFESITGFEQRIYFWDDEYHDSGGVHAEEVAPGSWEEVAWVIWGGEGWISLPFTAETSGNYQIELTGWGARVLDGIPVAMTMSLSDSNVFGGNTGSNALREHLQYLHDYLLGQNLPVNDTEIDAAFQLLIETWQARQERMNHTAAIDWDNEQCYLANGFWEQDQDIIDSILYDPALMKGTWSTVLIYLMTHYSYLHE